MITVAKLRRKPRSFQAFTGLSIAEFDQILCQVSVAYEAALHQQRNRSERQRALGAGRPFTLALAEKLLMSLMYLRLYVGQNLLAYLFDLDQSNVCRELKDRLLPILCEVLPTPLTDAPLQAPEKLVFPSDDTKEETSFAGKKRRRINTLKELLEAHPEIEELLLDSTEQSLRQPADKLKRKHAYSGKRQDHTVKTQIVATRQVILPVSGGLPGSLADQSILGASGVMRAVPAGVKIRIDKGYEGTAKRSPDKSVVAPVKKQRGHKVTLLGHVYNHLLSTLRIYVEHHFARLKCFGILRQAYRGRWEDHENRFCIVSGLLNYRATGEFSLGERESVKKAQRLLLPNQQRYFAFSLYGFMERTYCSSARAAMLGHRFVPKFGGREGEDQA